MWISRDEYQRLVSENATTKATLEWMRVQVNTIQAEKSAMLSAVTRQPVGDGSASGRAEPCSDGLDA